MGLLQFVIFLSVKLYKTYSDSFSGPTGKRLQEQVWTLPIVAYDPVPGKMPELSEEQLKDTSRDQYLAYRLGHALQSGDVPDEVAGATIGPCCHARWLTICVRCLRLAMSIKKRSKGFERILRFLLNLYLPSWFLIKNNPHCQSGAKHLYTMLELSRDLCQQSQETFKKVLQDNAYFAHPENLIIACLADHREVIRRKAVLYILAARRNFNIESHPRQFIPPTINFEVLNISIIGVGLT